MRMDVPTSLGGKTKSLRPLRKEDLDLLDGEPENSTNAQYRPPHDPSAARGLQPYQAASNRRLVLHNAPDYDPRGTRGTNYGGHNRDGNVRRGQYNHAQKPNNAKQGNAGAEMSTRTREGQRETIRDDSRVGSRTGKLLDVRYFQQPQGTDERPVHSPHPPDREMPMAHKSHLFPRSKLIGFWCINCKKIPDGGTKCEHGVSGPRV